MVGHVHHDLFVGPVSDSEKSHFEGSCSSLGLDLDTSESPLSSLLVAAVPPSEDSVFSWFVEVWGQALSESLNVQSYSGDDLIGLSLNSELSEGSVLSDVVLLSGCVGKHVLL